MAERLFFMIAEEKHAYSVLFFRENGPCLPLGRYAT